MSASGRTKAQGRTQGATQGRPQGKTIVARQLAEDLGVSVSTVSRAFSPESKISAKTRDMILAHAKAVGYQPNPFARSLITQKTGIVSVFISDIYNNPFFPEALTALTEALQAAGRKVMLFHVPRGHTPDEVLPQALAYQPEYVIVMTATVSFQTAMASADLGTHLIFFNRYVPDSPTFSVTCDNARGGWEVADFLLQTGHRRMAYIAGTPDATTSIDRGRGFAERCRAAGLEIVEDQESELFSYEDGYAAAKRLLTRHPDVDAIFGGNDIVALGAIDALRYELGLSVPDDVSVVGFDDVAMASWPSNRLTTYRHPVRRMVQATVDLIAQIDEQPECEPSARLVPGELIARRTHRERNP